MSLDGFVARENGGLDWLPAPVEGGDDHGYGAFFASVDALLMGRATFDTVAGFTSWPYGATPVTVLSRTLGAGDARLRDRPTVAVHGGPPQAALVDLGRAGARHVYVDGGRLVHACLAAGLLDALTVTVVPILLGGGRRLFGPLPGDVRLELRGERAGADGLVQLRYAILHGT